MKLFRLPSLHIALVFAAAATVFANATAWADAPSRVARLSESVGEIQLANEREGWHSISRNVPITAGDNVLVSQGGRAELDGGSIQLWLAGGSHAAFEQFDDQFFSARLVGGAMAVRVRSLAVGESVRVQSTYGEVVFTQPGFYVVTAPAVGAYEPQPAQPAQPLVKVRAGAAQFFALNRSPIAVQHAQVLLLDRNELRDSRFYRAPSLERFEAWASLRDSRINRFDQRYANLVSPLMIGARDLAEYGTWADGYEYGTVWYPAHIASDWAPYRYGRWSWVQPWGWTWVDDAAWGFAPFHYGRWVRIGTRWAWSPGQFAPRPVYAPALVTFFGGEQWSYGNAGPAFSWVPLGWNEPYTPWYSYTPTYWREVNRPYVRHPHFDGEPWRPQYYTHAAMPSAITAVTSAAFLSGRPVAPNQIRIVNERDLRSAPMARMGEVLPPPSRFAHPAPVLPPARAGEPNRFPTAPIVRPQGRGDAPLIVPNPHVLQPRVIPDSDFGAGRQPPSSNSRITEPATPMPKPREDRTMPPYTGPAAPSAPLAPVIPVAPVTPRFVAPVVPATPTAPTAPTVPAAPAAPQVPQVPLAPPHYRGVAPQPAPSALPAVGTGPQMNAPSSVPAVPAGPARSAESRNAPSPDAWQSPAPQRSAPPAYPPTPVPPAQPAAVTAPGRTAAAVVASVPSSAPTPAERRAPSAVVAPAAATPPFPATGTQPKTAAEPGARQDKGRAPVQPNAPQPLQQ